MIVGKYIRRGHVLLTAHASRVGPPRTPEFLATQFRQKGEGEDEGNQQIVVIIYKTEYVRKGEKKL